MGLLYLYLYLFSKQNGCQKTDDDGLITAYRVARLFVTLNRSVSSPVVSAVPCRRQEQGVRRALRLEAGDIQELAGRRSLSLGSRVA